MEILRATLTLRIQYDRTGRVWALELEDGDGETVGQARDQVRGLAAAEALQAVSFDLEAFLRLGQRT